MFPIEDDEDENDVFWDEKAFQHGWIRVFFYGNKKELNIEFQRGVPSRQAKTETIHIINHLSMITVNYVVEYYDPNSSGPTNKNFVQTQDPKEAIRFIRQG